MALCGGGGGGCGGGGWQDAAAKGEGTLVAFSEAKADAGTLTVVTGSGTRFKSQVAPGDKIRRRGSDAVFKVVSVESDTSLTLAPPNRSRLKEGKGAEKSGEKSGECNSEKCTEKGVAAEAKAPKWMDGTDCTFDVLGRIDQAAVFGRVLQGLAQGQCLGIFPEGGSSDRSWFNPGTMLSLKPGVAIIAMEAMRANKLAVPIVPVGMQYFDGDSFRGRCVIEFGPPILCPAELHKEYKEDKDQGKSGAKATTKLLESIEEGMRNCLVEAPSYEELELVCMVRRLFARDSRLNATQKQDLNRRFAYWYQHFFLKLPKDKVPADLELMNSKIRDYRDKLNLLGLKDYQVLSMGLCSALAERTRGCAKCKENT